MRGKFVNSLVGGMNLIFGAVVLLFKFYLPDTTTATAQELKVIGEIDTYIFVLMIVVAIVNFITLVFNRKDRIFLFSYIIAIFASTFYFLDFSYIGIIYVLAALLIEIQVLRENMLSVNNTFYMVIVSIVIVAIGIVAINIWTYKDRLKDIVKEENKGYLAYNEDYFKNISVLGEDSEFYLNVKREGKWGYINNKGETRLDFEFDYATPFISIEKYNKKFDIALVCKDDTASIILKNKRNVMTFKNDISADDYEAQMEKLEELYGTTFGQTGRLQDKLESVRTSNMSTISAYKEYPYRYPFNDEYDIYITVAQSGGKNRYEFLKRENPNIKVSIDCDSLKFDDKNLYVFSNGFLPFYKLSEGIQGWYTKETKRVELEGNLQILEFFDNQILIKNYDKNVFYFTNENGEQISPNYKDIFVLDDAYIVKNEQNKYMIIDSKFNKVWEAEYDYMNPMLLDQGIIICANLPLRVNFNASGFPSNIEYDLLDTSGNKISLLTKDGTVIENTTYTAVYYIDNKKTVSSYDLYIDNLTDIVYNFVGEEFYLK